MSASPPVSAVLASLEEELLRTRNRLASHEAALREALGERGVQLMKELELARLRAHEAALAQEQDPLTGTLRHGRFRQRLGFEVERSIRTGEGLSLVLVDVDGFTRFNAVHGYAAGDDALRALGPALGVLWVNEPARRPPVTGREAGDCFGVLLPATDGAELAARAEGLRDLVERLPWRGARLTASVGACHFLPPAGEVTVAPESLVACAWRALEEARQEGGNRVCVRVHGEAPPRG